MKFCYIKHTFWMSYLVSLEGFVSRLEQFILIHKRIKIPAVKNFHDKVVHNL